MDTMNEYKIKTTKQDEEHIDILIQSARSNTRHFKIIVSKDGLKISEDNEIYIKPRAANMVEIDSVS